MSLAQSENKPQASGPLDALVLGAVRWLRWLAPASRLRVARASAWVLWVLRVRRAVALDNLALAYPEKSDEERWRIARASYVSLTRAAIDAVTSDLISDAELSATVEVPDLGEFGRLVQEKKGFIIVSGHLGSWELFAEVMTRRGMSVSAVVRPLRGGFNAWVFENRRRAGMEIILQRGALSGMLAALKQNRSVVQLIDQALPSKNALWVPFFGRPASTTPSVAVAALRARVPVFVTVAVRRGDKLVMELTGPVAPPKRGTLHETVEAYTATLTQILEGYIRRYPEQWLWLHRRWKGQPPSQPRLASDATA